MKFPEWKSTPPHMQQKDGGESSFFFWALGAIGVVALGAACVVMLFYGIFHH